MEQRTARELRIPASASALSAVMEDKYDCEAPPVNDTTRTHDFEQHASSVQDTLSVSLSGQTMSARTAHDHVREEFGP